MESRPYSAISDRVYLNFGYVIEKQFRHFFTYRYFFSNYLNLQDGERRKKITSEFLALLIGWLMGQWLAGTVRIIYNTAKLPIFWECVLNFYFYAIVNQHVENLGRLSRKFFGIAVCLALTSFVTNSHSNYFYSFLKNGF